jgi:hypothetical protein
MGILNLVYIQQLLLVVLLNLVLYYPGTDDLRELTISYLRAQKIPSAAPGNSTIVNKVTYLGK